MNVQRNTKNRNSQWPAALALCAALTLVGGAWAQTKVVFQVSDNDPAKWALTLNNVRNAQVDLGEDKVIAEIVVYGPGIAMLKSGSPVADRVAEALGKNVQVVACQNTMQAMKLVNADMLPRIGYVPAGVVELIQRQGAGYAYIKP